MRGRVTTTPVTSIALGEFDALQRTDVRAAFLVNRMAARQVRTGGAIVNLVSSARAAYGAGAITAAATEALIRVLALELRDRDVTVNGVSLEADGRVTDIVAYLLSSAGHGITGRVIHRDDRNQVR